MSVTLDEDPSRSPVDAVPRRVVLERAHDVLRIRGLCPYLVADDGEWRSPSGVREHRCSAVRPATALSLEKQRRLCLLDDHATCATFAAARLRAGSTESSSGGTTRWALTRTSPVALDHGRLPGAARALAGQERRASQLALGGLMVVALVAVLVARASAPGGTPAAALATASAAAASPASTASSVPTATAASTGPSTAPVSPSPVAPSAAPSSPIVPVPSPASATYRVRAGDTLYGIAARFGTSVAALKAANGITDARVIRIGQTLVIPPAAR